MDDDDDVSSMDSWEECAIAMETLEQAMPTEAINDVIPEAMYDNWQLSPSPPSAASRPTLCDAAAIEKKRQAALKLRYEINVRRLKEAYHRAINSRPEAYDVAAIEAKRQAALKIRKKRHLQRIATVQRRNIPPHTVCIMPSRACTLSPTGAREEQAIEAMMMAIDETVLHLPQPPVQPTLSIPRQPGCHYAEDSQQPSTSNQGVVPAPLKPPSPPPPPPAAGLVLPRQPGCYYAEDIEQPSTSWHKDPSPQRKDHYSPEDFQANPNALFEELLSRMFDTTPAVEHETVGMSEASSEMEWMDELLRNLDASSQQGGQAPSTPPAATPTRLPSPPLPPPPPAQPAMFIPEEHYALHPGVYGWSAKFQTDTQIYNIEFQNLGKIAAPDYHDNIAMVLDAAVREVARDMQPNDMIRFYMNSDAWRNPINMPYMRVNELTGRRVLQEFMKTDQSNGNTGLEGTGVVLDIVRTIMPQPGAGWTIHGSGRTRIFLELAKWLKTKRCAITTIDNTDKMCLARSIVVAKAHWKYTNQPDNTPEQKTRKRKLYNKKVLIQRVDRTYQHGKALKLCQQAGVSPHHPCGIPEIQTYQDHLRQKGHRLIIYSAEANFDCIFKGPEACPKPLPVLHYNQHYVVLTSMAAFCNTSHFCWDCLKG